MMKFLAKDGKIITIRSDQAVARRCYNTSLKICGVKKMPLDQEKQENVLSIDLDVRCIRLKERLELKAEMIQVQIGNTPNKFTKINA